jgi:hypothetical protein
MIIFHEKTLNSKNNCATDSFSRGIQYMELSCAIAHAAKHRLLIVEATVHFQEFLMKNMLEGGSTMSTSVLPCQFSF